MSDLKTFQAVIDSITEIRKTKAVPTKGGKRYTQVQDRVEAFRRHFGAAFGIETHVTCDSYDKGKPVVARAIIRDEGERVIATGHAVEFWGGTGVNSTSALENAETSAIGRALAALGIHGGEFASVNEMEGVERKGEAKPDAEKLGRKSSAALKREEVWPEFMAGLAECETADAVIQYMASVRDGPSREWPTAWWEAARNEGHLRLRELEFPAATSSPAAYRDASRGQ